MMIPIQKEDGFTLMEIAIVILIVGLLAGGGVSLMGTLSRHKTRNETSSYLQKAKAALISYSEIHGRLPAADTNADGNEDIGSYSGDLPYLTLKLSPSDSNRRVLKYALNSNLNTDRIASCTALRLGLSGGPNVVDADGVATAFQTAAVLVSAGPTDADNDGNVFDDLAGAFQGDNRDGTPNYIRHPPTDVFDDLVVYIGENELYGQICEYLVLAVNNNSSSMAYVHDRTSGTDLSPALNSGDANTYTILSGTQIEILNGPGGGGSNVTSNPPTPVALAGHGFTINIP
jgi:prepilin-type N-terminal cleavage/methylation domain-containing protein